MTKRKIITLIVCLVIFAVAAVLIFFIFNTEPEAKSEAASKKTAMLVSVDKVEKGNFVPEFITTGTVQAEDQITLSTMVGGEVTYHSPNFVPGGIVKKGQVLLRINPADYQNELALRRSELAQAKSDLTLEMGRQTIAASDLALVGADSITSNQRNLVLRKPQLETVKARIQFAEAAVQQAQLNLNRTSIRAPFDAQIIQQNVNLGSLVAPNDNLGQLVGTSHYWINTAVPLSQLAWMEIPVGNATQGTEVQIRNTTSWASDMWRSAYIYRQVGALDEQSRLANLLIRADQPLGNPETGIPGLIIGEFMEVKILGKEIENVIRVNRDYVRNNETVWVKENGLLKIKKIEIELMDAKYAYVSSGINDQDEIVTTNISTVTNDIPLRTQEDSAQSIQQKPITD